MILLDRYGQRYSGLCPCCWGSTPIFSANGRKDFSWQGAKRVPTWKISTWACRKSVHLFTKPAKQNKASLMPFVALDKRTRKKCAFFFATARCLLVSKCCTFVVSYNKYTQVNTLTVVVIWFQNSYLCGILQQRNRL